MAFYSLLVRDLIKHEWNYNEPIYYRVSLTPDILKKQNTYLIIFAEHQNEDLWYFCTELGDKINVLFEGQAARNTVHPGSNRNTLIIFELKDE